MRSGLKAVVLVLGFVALTVGVTGCAKYPVLVDEPKTAVLPPAPTPPPTR